MADGELHRELVGFRPTSHRMTFGANNEQQRRRCEGSSGEQTGRRAASRHAVRQQAFEGTTMSRTVGAWWTTKQIQRGCQTVSGRR